MNLKPINDFVCVKPDSVVNRSAFGIVFVEKDADIVYIFADDNKIGLDIGRSTRWVIMKALRNKGIKVFKNTEITQIMNNYVMTSDPENNLISIDTVIVASKPEPRERLIGKLKSEGMVVKQVGSVVKPSNLCEAVHQAFELANNLIL